MTSHRHKRLKGINGSQAKLSLFQKNQPSGLSSTAILALYYSSQGLNQKAISEQIGCSPANVNKVMKRLREKGLLVKPHKAGRLIGTAGGGYSLPIDVRFRSLKWKLAHSVNMPSDESMVNSGVRTAIWHVKGSTVRQNIGKNTCSLEIECGYTEGSSMKEVARKHDEEALNTYDWLCEHYPELKEASVRLGYELNRKGEITVPQLKEFAEEWLKAHPRLDIGIFKIDDSLKNGGEFQIRLDYLMTQEDVEQLREGMRRELRDFAKFFAAELKDAIAGKPEQDAPSKPYEGGDYV
jgi:biotin operon repressor